MFFLKLLWRTRKVSDFALNGRIEKTIPKKEKLLKAIV